ncbi:MAG: hypothetical protein ACR2G6_12705 [Gemmatimonadaceae bacterium]
MPDTPKAGQRVPRDDGTTSPGHTFFELHGFAALQILTCLRARDRSALSFSGAIRLGRGIVGVVVVLVHILRQSHFFTVLFGVVVLLAPFEKPILSGVVVRPDIGRIMARPGGGYLLADLGVKGFGLGASSLVALQVGSGFSRVLFVRAVVLVLAHYSSLGEIATGVATVVPE